MHRQSPASIAAGGDHQRAQALRGHHRAATLVALLAAAALLLGLARPPRRTASPAAARPAVEPAPFGIDPNRATWSEFAQLPGIGEITARHIVEHRESRRAAGKADDPTRAVFLQPADLLRIRGIGAKTIQRIAPHLRFPAAPAR